MARTCVNAVDLLPEVKGGDIRIDDIEATIQALAAVLETQVGELISWMETPGWDRRGKRWLVGSIVTALMELERKIEAIERVKNDLKAIQQRFV